MIDDLPDFPAGEAFQDQIRGNHCFGCGANNPEGLHIKSYWSGDDDSICQFLPRPCHTAASATILNGGIVATLIDCHSVCTAIAHAYRAEDREIGTSPDIWFATGGLSIRYLKPAPVAGPIVVRARVVTAGPRKVGLHAELAAGAELCADAEVIAVRVPEAWLHSR